MKKVYESGSRINEAKFSRGGTAEEDKMNWFLDHQSKVIARARKNPISNKSANFKDYKKNLHFMENTNFECSCIVNGDLDILSKMYSGIILEVVNPRMLDYLSSAADRSVEALLSEFMDYNRSFNLAKMDLGRLYESEGIPFIDNRGELV